MDHFSLGHPIKFLFFKTETQRKRCNTCVLSILNRVKTRKGSFFLLILFLLKSFRVKALAVQVPGRLKTIAQHKSIFLRFLCFLVMFAPLLKVHWWKMLMVSTLLTVRDEKLFYFEHHPSKAFGSINLYLDKCLTAWGFKQNWHIRQTLSRACSYAVSQPGLAEWFPFFSFFFQKKQSRGKPSLIRSPHVDRPSVMFLYYKIQLKFLYNNFIISFLSKVWINTYHFFFYIERKLI